MSEYLRDIGLLTLDNVDQNIINKYNYSRK